MELDDAPRHHEKRGEARTPLTRTAGFMLLRHPERGWGSCRITDISRGGAGLVLFGPPWPRYRSDRNLLVRLDDDLISSRRAPYLEALVRNTCATEGGWLRVGVEFVVVTATQQAAVSEWLRLLFGS